MARLKNIVTLIGIATAAGGGSTMAIKDTDLLRNMQATISSLQSSVTENLASAAPNLGPLIAKIIKENK